MRPDVVPEHDIREGGHGHGTSECRVTNCCDTDPFRSLLLAYRVHPAVRVLSCLAWTGRLIDDRSEASACSTSASSASAYGADVRLPGPYGAWIRKHRITLSKISDLGPRARRTTEHWPASYRAEMSSLPTEFPTSGQTRYEIRQSSEQLGEYASYTARARTYRRKLCPLQDSRC